MPRQRLVIDPQVSPTAKVSKDQVQQSLDALQIEGLSAAAIAATNLGPILVAITAHLGRNGVYLQEIADEDPPKTKANPLGQKRR